MFQRLYLVVFILYFLKKINAVIVHYLRLVMYSGLILQKLIFLQELIFTKIM